MLQTLLHDHAKKGLLIDTNLLVLLVVGSVGKEYITQSTRTQGFTERDFDILRATIALSPGPILTTPHILAETSNLVASALRGKQGQVARQLLGTLILSNLEEHYIQGRAAAAGPLFQHFGLTDSAIGMLKVEQYAVLTADAPLYGILASRMIPAILFAIIRTLVN